MKLTDAWIDDPLARGEYLVPKLSVSVDGPILETMPMQSFDDGWAVYKYGPFIKYAIPFNCELSAADFNMRFPKIFAPVVDVVVWQDAEWFEGYAMPVTRARQLLRKHQPKWRLLLSDTVAQNGGMVWAPVQSDPPCKWWSNKTICGKKTVAIVKSHGLDVPYCVEHLRRYNENNRTRRQSTTSS